MINKLICNSFMGPLLGQKVQKWNCTLQLWLDFWSRQLSSMMWGATLNMMACVLMFSYTTRDKSHCFNTQPCSWHLTSFDSKHRADQVDSLLTLEIKWDVLQVIFLQRKGLTSSFRELSATVSWTTGPFNKSSLRPCYTPLCSVYVRHLTLGHTHIAESLVFPHMDHITLIYKQIRPPRSPLLPSPLVPCTLITCSFPSRFVWVFPWFSLFFHSFLFFFLQPRSLFALFPNTDGWFWFRGPWGQGWRISFIIDKKPGKSIALAVWTWMSFLRGSVSDSFIHILSEWLREQHIQRWRYSKYTGKSRSVQCHSSLSGEGLGVEGLLASGR